MSDTSSPVAGSSSPLDSGLSSPREQDTSMDIDIKSDPVETEETPHEEPEKRKPKIQLTFDSFKTKPQRPVTDQSYKVSLKIRLKSPQPEAPVAKTTKASVKKSVPKKKKAAKNQQTLPREPSEPEDLPWTPDDELANVQPEAGPDAVEHMPEVAFLVMLQARFYPLFTGTQPVGPQTIEEAVMGSGPFTGHVEQFMCRLLTLVLNRKKPVETGKYRSALEEIHTKLPVLGRYPSWPMEMNLKSRDPIGELESWQDRLGFLHMLGLWALSNSDSIRQILADVAPKQPGAEDEFVGVRVEPLGHDASNFRYYLIRGNGDSPFRVYRQTNPRLRYVNWSPVASTADELVAFASGPLGSDSSRQAAKLRTKLIGLVDEIRACEERALQSVRRDVRRQNQLRQIAMARSGEGKYTGRTRGRRVDYSMDQYAEVGEDSDYDDGYSDGTRGTRRSARIRGAVDYSEVEQEAPRRGRTSPRFQAEPVGMEVGYSEVEVPDEVTPESSESNGLIGHEAGGSMITESAEPAGETAAPIVSETVILAATKDETNGPMANSTSQPRVDPENPGTVDDDSGSGLNTQTTGETSPSIEHSTEPTPRDWPLPVS